LKGGAMVQGGGTQGGGGVAAWGGGLCWARKKEKRTGSNPDANNGVGKTKRGWWVEKKIFNEGGARPMVVNPTRVVRREGPGGRRERKGPSDSTKGGG